MLTILIPSIMSGTWPITEDSTWLTRPGERIPAEAGVAILAVVMAIEKRVVNFIFAVKMGA